MNRSYSPANQSRQQLRQQLRAQRNALSQQQQYQAGKSLKRIFSQKGLLTGARSIAFYLANDGEINPYWLMHEAMKRNISCYLPVLAPNKTLWFVHYQRNDRLNDNHYGIAEPAKWKPRRKNWSLDVVLMPLVGFDRQGARLGMGGGFYDRSFSWIKQRPAICGPTLIGLAHHCQEVDSLALESWDIPMSYIATDKELIKVKNSKL